MNNYIFKYADLKKCIYKCDNIEDKDEKELCIKKCKDSYMKSLGFININNIKKNFINPSGIYPSST